MRTKLSCVVCTAFILLTASLQASAAESNAKPRPSRYRTSPFLAMQQAIALIPAVNQPPLSSYEIEMFREIEAGRAKKFRLSEAMLTTSGITDPRTRARCVQRFDEITIEARAAISKGTTSNEKATLLATYLFKGPCHGGFSDNQTDIARLLDTGQFNCVSSSILYNVIANRLGMKTEAVEIPGHVLLRYGDLYIEPVCGKTFSAKDHQFVIDQQWEKAPERIRPYYNSSRMYVSGNMGLLALPYVNQAATFESRKRFDQSSVSILKAASLDPKNALFAYYAKVHLEKWFNAELQEKHFNTAQQIAAIYGQLFGDESNELFDQVAAAKS